MKLNLRSFWNTEARKARVLMSTRLRLGRGVGGRRLAPKAKPDGRRLGGSLWRELLRGAITTSRNGFRISYETLERIGFFDFIKGIIMVVIAYFAGLDAGQQLVVGMAVIVGHNWPIFLRFHGGRGIATLLGIVIILPIINDISPWPSVIAVGFAVLVTIIFLTSAVPVLIGVASLPLTSWLFGEENAVALTYFAIFLIVVIKRLTAQKSPEKRKIGMGRLLLNRLLHDRDIADKKAWMQRKHIKKKAPTP